MSNTFDKLSILDSFIEEVDSYLPEIEANLDRMAQDVQAGRAANDMDVLEETYRRTHTIGGSASMMDFSGLAHVAHGMEDILGDVLDELAALDMPTIELLQRSLGRLRRLLEGVRSESDGSAIAAEDDADYEQYRASQEQGQTSQEKQGIQQESSLQPTLPMSPVFDMPSHLEMGLPPSQEQPTFDEVLASFRTPSLDTGDVEWPEEFSEQEIGPLSYEDAHTASATPQQFVVSPDVHNPASSQSALEELVASTSTSSLPPLHTSTQVSENTTLPEQPYGGREASNALQEVPSTQLPQAYNDVEHDVHALERQVVSIRGLISQLRSAVSIVEAQRSEFKGFLDGSKDALDRMEDWAGKTMGLNLRNSPEQVRKYLPLSVMWAANSKLKKVLELLHQVTNGAEVTDEQMHTLMEHLHTSIVAYGDAFTKVQDEAASSRVLTQEEGWTPWEMQTATNHDNGLQERVTFERSGNLEEIRKQAREEVREEVEANLRDELEREYKSLSLASRTELEQNIRNEVRQELEANRRLQEQVSGVDVSGLRQELERQLRYEIEIQVRQEFLDNIGATQIGTASENGNVVATSSGMATQDASRQQQNVQQDEHSMHSLITPTSVSEPLTTPSVSFMPAMSNDFAEEATEIFRLEAEEHLQTISTCVAGLEKEPTNREYIQGIRRATHTLKGAAGMMGFRTIAELSHISEDLLDNIMEEETPISSEVLSIILDTAETLDTLITGKSDANAQQVRIQVLRARYVQLLGERDVLDASSIDDMELEEEEGSVDEHTTDAALAVQATSSPSTQPVEVHMQRATINDLSVRVNLQKLDELVNLFGELLVNRSVLEERVQRLVRLVADVGISSNRLRDVGQRLESRFEAATLPSGRSLVVMPGEGDNTDAEFRKGRGTEPAHLADFDELEMDRYTEFHQLARGLSEGITDMSTLSIEMEALIRECESIFSRESRLSTTFQDRLMKTRLVPLSTMAPRLERAARAVAFKQHKEVDFILEGGETEVDRIVYEEISGPLLHLMRNAVNHAIETPEVRMQQGKPAKGRVTFNASYESNQIVITVRDDGSGINSEHIRNVALARGLIGPNQVLSESEAIELIFRPGFSTSEVVSEESGRGVGLDVVRDSVSRLRGTIEVESMPNQGTAFTMKFPTSMAIQSAMMVMVGGQQFAIPTITIESIGRLDTFKRTMSDGQPMIVVRDELYPLSMLAQYLNFPSGQITDKSHILLVNAGGQRVALVIDEVKGKFDVVTKNLGSHLRNVYGIAGATVLGNGQVVLILELTELLSTRNRSVGGSSVSTAKPRRESGRGTTSSVASLQPSVGSQTMPLPPVSSLPRVQQQSLATPIPQTPPIPVRQRVEVQPAAPVSRPMGTGRSSSNTESTDKGKYVLVVDDSPSVRRVVSSMLKQNGWDVQMARDGVEALDIISRDTPAAVLLDIEMPRMDGYELIATVRAQEQYRNLPMVVLTSRAASKHQQRAMQLGASGYVIKPYQDEELLSTLDSLVYGAMVR